MEGAGGTIDDLAGLVVQYIRIVVGRHPPSLVSRSNSEYIRGICFSLRDADPSLETEQQRSLPPLGALHSILLHHGLVGTLVAAMLSVSSTPGPETGFVLDECFMLLERILLASPGYLWIEEAMYAGLIQVIVSSATFTQIGQVTLHLHFFLDLVFPAGLLAYYTLHQFRCSYARVQELVSTEEFQTCDISSHWRRFMSLANERLEFLAEFDSAEFVSPTACDNLAVRSFAWRRFVRHLCHCASAGKSNQRLPSVDARDARPSIIAAQHARETDRIGGRKEWPKDSEQKPKFH
ncbi:hypothetical protein B0H10DRAFT_2376390 [Mycena sp. CBHHK59/15]|nr:hypothetical protein B0H10DRAFT_2376390 [Mycena sp. CBHHK59/15]